MRESLYTAYSSGQGCGSLAISSHVNRLRDFQESAMQNKRFLSSRAAVYDRLEHRAGPSDCPQRSLERGEDRN